MIFDDLVLLYILLALAVIVIAYSIKRIATVRVWIKTSPKAGKPKVELGYLQLDNDGTAGEVKLSASGGKAPIARVVVDNQSNKSNGYVELITTDIEDDTVKPNYKQVGYVDENGIIYKHVKGKRREQIGYTACPSAPNTPTIYGERSWKTLWLRCTLYAYFGEPNADADKQAAEEKKKGMKNKKGKEKDTKEVKETPAPENKDSEVKESDNKTNDNTSPEPSVKETPINGLKLMSINGKADKSIKTDVEPVAESIISEASEKTNDEVKDVVVAENETKELPGQVTSGDMETEVSPHDHEPEEGAVSHNEGNSQDNSDAPQQDSEQETQQANEENGEQSTEDKEEKSNEKQQEQKEQLEDPFAALSDQEKKRLDGVKRTFPKMLSGIIDNMICVDGGTFTMGDDPKDNTTVDEDGKSRGKVECNESPKHKVTLDTYYIYKYPVSQAEWKNIMGSNPSECQDNPNYPVAPITWHEAQDFILRLSYLTGISFKLPTEAQWEYAARGGKKSKGYTFSGSDNFSEVGFSDYKHSVGQKAPNELGIYDMSGLVREWCSDIWGHYSEEDQTNPTGPTEDSPLVIREVEDAIYYVVRSPSGNETVCNRKGEAPDLGKEFKSYGFRFVCSTLPEKTKKDDEQKKAASPAPAPVIKEKDKAKVPAAVCHFWGFHNSKKDDLPAEARAGAYALLSQKFPRRNYSEYYKDRPYGWLDTALLTTVIFTVLYLALYLVNTGILRMPLLGEDFFAVGILIAFYYLLWALVRAIKIDCIENGNSFQPKLYLFNKNLSLGFTNWSILFMGAIAMYFTMEYYDYDFIPLIWAIMSGVGCNMLLKSANTKWVISSTFNEKDDLGEEDEEAEIKNPDGDISRTYDWELDSTYSSQKVHGNLTLYFYANEMTDLRQCNPFFAQRKDRNDEDYILDMYNFMISHPTFIGRVKYIVSVIDRIVEKQSLTPIDRMQFALDFVQEPNIQFVENKDDKIIHSYDDYIRYPDETLYDRTGDSNSKSLLAAMIFHVMGFNVLYMISRKHQHSAIGIEIKQEDLEKGWYGSPEKLKDSIIEEGSKKYIFCETTGDRFAIGSTIKDVSVDDFERKVLLGSEDEENDNEQATPVEPTSEETITRMYNWDLDEQMGKLHGTLTLDFTESEIKSLRELNPFQTYVQEGNRNTYEMNVQSIFNYFSAKEAHMARVKTVTEYIKKSIDDAGLSKLHLAQFALDFAQEPNIHYEVDEKSKGIDCAKEYMRFPDEVLFDKEGDCDCKSSLTCALFHCLGFNVIFMLSEKLKHAAIGIEAEEEWLSKIEMDDITRVLREYNGKQYLYCETTGDNFRIGFIKDGSIQDFEHIVEILA